MPTKSPGNTAAYMQRAFSAVPKPSLQVIRVSTMPIDMGLSKSMRRGEQGGIGHALRDGGEFSISRTSAHARGSNSPCGQLE